MYEKVYRETCTEKEEIKKKKEERRIDKNFHCFPFSFTFSRVWAMYTDKHIRVKEKELTTKKFQRILITVSTQRPNTVVVLLILVISTVRLACESIVKGTLAFFRSPTPLKPTWLTRLIHWVMIDGPKHFWKFPTAIQIGRSISTFIQVVFYPKIKK